MIATHQEPRSGSIPKPRVASGASAPWVAIVQPFFLFPGIEESQCAENETKESRQWKSQSHRNLKRFQAIRTRPTLRATNSNHNNTATAISGAPGSAIKPVHNPGSTGSQIVGQQIVTWLIWRGTAAMPWYWLLGAIVERVIGQDLPYTGWVLLAPVFAFFVIAIFYGVLMAAGYIVYTLLFPSIMIGLFVWFAPEFFRGVWKYLKILTNLFAAMSVAIILVLLSVSLAVIENPDATLAIVYVKLLLLMWFLLSAVRWAADPLRPFHSLLSWVEYFLSWAESQVTIKPASSPEESQKSRNGNLQLLGYFEVGFNWMMGRIDVLVKRTIVPLFSAILSCIFLFMVIEYGTIIYALQGQELKAFGGLPQDYRKCCIYSLSVLVTGPVSDVLPSSDLGYVVYGTGSMTTFLLISVFFSMFAAAMGMHGEARMKELDCVSKQVRDWITAKRQEWTGEIIQVKTTQFDSTIVGSRQQLEIGNSRDSTNSTCSASSIKRCIIISRHCSAARPGKAANGDRPWLNLNSRGGTLSNSGRECARFKG